MQELFLSSIVIQSFFQSYSIPELVLLAIFALALIIQLLYYWIVFRKLAFYKIPVKSSVAEPAVSVVISARNEYYNLMENLPLILGQQYPDFEVIVVNHASEDDSHLLLKELKSQYANLRVLTIERDLNFFQGKKFPLSLGIKAAKNDILLLTDADCKPGNDNWIASTVQNYGIGTEVVLGYGPYSKTRGFLNLLIRYDTFFTAMQYFSYALLGNSYMGVGRNLSYKRSLFFRNKGFTSHYQIASGDDDLFINEVSTRKNTNIALDKDSFMYSVPEKTFSNWVYQKRRHLTTGRNYKKKFKLFLGTYSLSQVLVYVLGIALLVLNVLPWVVIGGFLLRLLSQIVVNKKVIAKLHEDQLYLFSLIGEVIYILIIPVLALTNVFSKKIKWK